MYFNKDTMNYYLFDWFFVIIKYYLYVEYILFNGKYY
jgi:hypothetical protein